MIGKFSVKIPRRKVKHLLFGFVFILVVYILIHLFQRILEKSKVREVVQTPHSYNYLNKLSKLAQIENSNLSIFLSFIRNNEVKCSELNSKNILLVLVHSARGNLARRSAFRKTIGSIKKFHELDIVLIFLLGQSANLKSPEIIETFGNDIVIGNFTDTYRNLSYKHLMGYKWAVEYCPGAKFILKMDDDVFFNLFEVSRILSELENDEYYVCNSIEGSTPIREKMSRSYVSLAEYPGAEYPMYCSGLAYIVRFEAATAIWRASQKVHFFWVDDAWITGLLRITAEFQDKKKFAIKPMNDLYFIPTTWMFVDDVARWYRNFSDLRTSLPWTFVLLDWDSPENLASKMIAMWTKNLAIQLNNSQITFHMTIE